MSDTNSPWPAPVPQEPNGDSGAPFSDAWSSGDAPLAGFWMRFVAYLIDTATVALVVLPLRVASFVLHRSNDSSLASLTYIASVAVSVYAYSYWTGVKGGTPLRRALGVYIVDQDNGSFIGMRRGVKRVLMGSVSLVAFLIGYLWMFNNPRKQTWHDIVAKSVVIRR